jgi:hypothetical protein
MVAGRPDEAEGGLTFDGHFGSQDGATGGQRRSLKYVTVALHVTDVLGCMAKPDVIKARGWRFNKFKAAQLLDYGLHAPAGGGGIALINLSATRVIDYFHDLPPL